MPDPVSIYNIVQTGGVVAVLLIMIIGGVKKWWVFGWQYRAIEESNIRWMELALRSTNLSESLDDINRRQPPKLP
jgi:hypothetical protein